MMERFDYGAEVRVIRNVRNDGTFPGTKVGELLVRRGSVGYVRDVGTFLQDQVIYTIHFLEAGRVVGCRAEELIDAADPWVPSRFEFREKVRCAVPLAVRGEVVIEQGREGEVVKVLRDGADGVAYHVLFQDRVFRVPESSLLPREEMPE